MTFYPTEAELRLYCPNARKGWVEAFAQLAPVLCQHYDFNRLRWIHFAAQWGFESGGLTIIRENMNFTTVKRIKEIYSYRLSLCIKKVNSGEVSEPKIAKGSTVDKLAQACVRNPILLADIVYGGREGTPWMQGSRYVGRGPLQATHLNNYRRIYNEIRNQPGGEKCPDLVVYPEALEQPEWGIRSAFADWMIKGLHEWADRDDVDIVSDILNTGNHRDNIKPHGLKDRRRWLAKAAARWPHEEHRPVSQSSSKPQPAAPAPEPVPASEPVVVAAPEPTAPAILRPGDQGMFVKALQERLKELGYFSGLIDGKYGPLTERAVTNFQREHGLVPDGIVGDRTRQALDRSAPLDLGERANLGEKDLLARGSRIVKFGRRIRAFGKWLWGITFGTFLGEATGFGVVENAVFVGERINAFIDKFNVGGPKFWILLALVMVSIIGYLISKWGDETVKARVEDARTGANLSR